MTHILHNRSANKNIHLHWMSRSITQSIFCIGDCHDDTIYWILLKNQRNCLHQSAKNLLFALIKADQDLKWNASPANFQNHYTINIHSLNPSSCCSRKDSEAFSRDWYDARRSQSLKKRWKLRRSNWVAILTALSLFRRSQYRTGDFLLFVLK